VTHGRAEIHELLVANDLRPSRALGQNFVADGNTVRRIVRLAGITEGQRVVEIGAGLGSLTLALVEAGATVTAVEIDRHVLPVLRAQVEPAGVRVVEADALRLDWSDLLGGEGAATDGPWSLVANLPYNMAVPLVMRVLEEAPQVTSLLVMVQREVGERLAAAAGDEAYGAVSVKVAYWADATVVGRVSASVFIPKPRVESVLVRLDRRLERGVDGDGGGPGSAQYERLFAVVRAGFAHRRKMLRRCLDGLVRPEAFDAVGIRSTARAEELSLGEWERLAAWGTDGSGPDEEAGDAAAAGGPSR
jgi:16S rRNA (adenine1518-N6/adenine1519-N6)-dimethyltransferase